MDSFAADDSKLKPGVEIEHAYTVDESDVTVDIQAVVVGCAEKAYDHARHIYDVALSACVFCIKQYFQPEDPTHVHEHAESLLGALFAALLAGSLAVVMCARVLQQYCWEKKVRLVLEAFRCDLDHSVLSELSVREISLMRCCKERDRAYMQHAALGINYVNSSHQKDFHMFHGIPVPMRHLLNRNIQEMTPAMWHDDTSREKDASSWLAMRIVRRTFKQLSLYPSHEIEQHLIAAVSRKLEKT